MRDGEHILLCEIVEDWLPTLDPLAKFLHGSFEIWHDRHTHYGCSILLTQIRKGGMGWPEAFKESVGMVFNDRAEIWKRGPDEVKFGDTTCHKLPSSDPDFFENIKRTLEDECYKVPVFEP